MGASNMICFDEEKRVLLGKVFICHIGKDCVIALLLFAPLVHCESY